MELKGVHTKYIPIFHVSQLFLPGRFLFVCLFVFFFQEKEGVCRHESVVLRPGGSSRSLTAWASCGPMLAPSEVDEL